MKTVYAWCFSHGTLHQFAGPEGPWCTADWVWLSGFTIDQALAAKQAAYGDAQFLDQLPAETQLAVINGEIPGQRTEAGR